MGEHAADFLIVGGGIAGVSVAARLAPLGTVILVEREHALAYHASGRSAALFLPCYGNHVIRTLNEASADHHTYADGGVLRPRDMMIVARHGEDAAFETELAEIGLTEISIDTAREHMPILNPATCVRAGIYQASSDLDTDLLIQNFLRHLRASGGRVEQNAPVTTISRHDGIWHVTAGERTFHARTLINAAGAWADQIATMAGTSPLGIQPFRRSMARLPAPGGHDVSRWPFVAGLHDRWYAKPDAGKLIVSPSEQDPVPPQDAFPDDMVLAEGLARYEEMVTEPVTRVEHSWAGLRSFAPDRSLVIGRDRKEPSFFWMAGQGGYGFQTAPAASQLAADLLSGRPPAIADTIVAALSPDRF